MTCWLGMWSFDGVLWRRDCVLAGFGWSGSHSELSKLSH